MPPLRSTNEIQTPPALVTDSWEDSGARTNTTNRACRGGRANDTLETPVAKSPLCSVTDRQTEKAGKVPHPAWKDR